MNTDLRENYIKSYKKAFKDNPKKFAISLTNEQIKSYGVSNNDFWKSFIVNLDNDNCQNAIKNDKLYTHLAKIYFITIDKKKCYLLEKLPNIVKPNLEDVKKLADELKQDNIEVVLDSAVVTDVKTNQIKFTKYKINKG